MSPLEKAGILSQANADVDTGARLNRQRCTRRIGEVESR